MLDANAYINYCKNYNFETMKLLVFANENKYLVSSGFPTDDESITYIFLPTQLPVAECEGDYPRIRTCNEISIKIHKDLYVQLILDCKLADYVIEKVKKRNKED